MIIHYTLSVKIKYPLVIMEFHEPLMAWSQLEKQISMIICIY